MSDANGYGYGAGDAGGNIVFQKTPSPNVPGNSTTYSIAPGRLSHVRSWGVDSGNLLYMAFTDTGLSNIQISNGTTSQNTTWASPTTLFDDSSYDDIRDPGMSIMDDTIYLCFVRQNTSTSEYELCFMKGDTSYNFNSPLVVETSTTAFDDAHIETGQFFGFNVVGISYQEGNTVYFTYSSNDGGAWEDPEVVQQTYSATEDCDVTFLTQTGSLQQDLIVIWSEDNGSGYRDIKTRMAHFVN